MEEEKIILYTTHCPRCKAVEIQLDRKGIKYEVVDDPDAVVAFGEAHGIIEAPLLEVGSKAMDFRAALNWVKEHK